MDDHLADAACFILHHDSLQSAAGTEKRFGPDTE
jgi:hypothetical protein